MFAVRRMLEAGMVRAFMTQNMPVQLRAFKAHVTAEKKVIKR